MGVDEETTKEITPACRQAGIANLEWRTNSCLSSFAIRDSAFIAPIVMPSVLFPATYGFLLRHATVFAMRPRAFLLSCLSVSVVGVLLGFLVIPRVFPRSDFSPPSPGESSVFSVIQEDIAGFCCFAAGESCAPQPSPQHCISNGGKLFHIDRTLCDNDCVRLGAE